jgi:hypothetical protein|tara:strand:- start:72 stop:737 length:666 start_codon:yes stop_codon:yes gene_type:complete
MANTYSIDLDGNNQSLSRADNADLRYLTADRTLECWIKPNDTSGVQTVVSKWATYQDYILYMNGSTLTFAVLADTSNTVTTTVSSGTWTHVACTMDSSKNLEMFINGSSVDTATSTGTVATSTDIFIIGQNSSSNYYEGLIDEVRFWHEIRTGTEISNNYQKELTGSETNLVGYWKLNNDLLDATSNSYDLTNNNSATFSTDVPFVGDDEESNAIFFGMNF